MIRILSLFLLLWGIHTNAFAFQGDYVLEEKFKAELLKAHQGDAKAQYVTGELYENGRGTDPNNKEAFTWYSKSAKQGYIKAFNKLGAAYLHGKGVKKNPQKAYQWLKKAADKGNSRAFFHLGEIYEYGYGKSRDYKLSLQWYQKARTAGFDAASQRIRRVTAALNKQETEELLSTQTAAQEEAEKMRLEHERLAKIRSAEEQQKELLEKQAQQKALDLEKKLAAEKIAKRQQIEKMKQSSAAKKQATPPKAKSIGFKSDPCKTRAAKYMSTCR